MKMADVREFIDTLSETDLIEIRDWVSDRLGSQTDLAFLDALKSALADADLEYPADQVVKVEFGTWEWDNGWFYQESAATVTYRNGESEDDVDLSAIDDELTEMSAQGNAEYGGLGRENTLTVTLPAGDIEHE